MLQLCAPCAHVTCLLNVAHPRASRRALLTTWCGHPSNLRSQLPSHATTAAVVPTTADAKPPTIELRPWQQPALPDPSDHGRSDVETKDKGRSTTSSLNEPDAPSESPPTHVHAYDGPTSSDREQKKSTSVDVEANSGVVRPPDDTSTTPSASHAVHPLSVPAGGGALMGSAVADVPPDTGGEVEEQSALSTAEAEVASTPAPPHEPSKQLNRVQTLLAQEWLLADAQKNGVAPPTFARREGPMGAEAKVEGDQQVDLIPI